MSINANDVLDLLDEHINISSTGLAPLLFQLWTHFFPADMRLSVFRSEDDWAVFIEMVCFRPGQEDSSLETWCYSNCLSEPGLLWYDTPYEFCRPDDVQEDGDGYPETPFQFCIVRDGERLGFAPTPEEFAQIGVVLAPDFNEGGNHVGGHVLRFLCERLGYPFFASEEGLRQLLEDEWHVGNTPRAAEMVLLWQTSQWRHPANIGPNEDTERPRNLPYFHALARAIATGDVADLQQQDPATFNTDWRIWDAEERAQEAASQARREVQEQMIRQQPPEVQEQLRALGGWFVIATQTEEAVEGEE